MPLPAHGRQIKFGGLYDDPLAPLPSGTRPRITAVERSTTTGLPHEGNSRPLKHYEPLADCRIANKRYGEISELTATALVPLSAPAIIPLPQIHRMPRCEVRSTMNGRSSVISIIFLAMALIAPAAADAQTPGQPQQDTSAFHLGDIVSLPKPSLDSAMAWTDQYFFHQWRIQQHVDSNECRLLDEDGNLHTTGTYAECRTELDSIRSQQNLEPMHGKAVVLLHGLAAPCWSMQLLARHLRQNGNFETFAIDYASTRSTIDAQAQSLARVIESLEGIEEINLVGHSMGNIVIRRYLAGDPSPNAGWHADPRIKRIVMIAPPNHGSITATRLSDYSLFKAALGKSARQLGVEWPSLETRLAIPTCQFGIIAGGYGNRLGLNPFLPGDDDGRITVETTRLAGATDFQVIPAVHEFIANDPRVFNYTLHFLQDGYFISPEQRVAIPRGEVANRPSPSQKQASTTR